MSDIIKIKKLSEVSKVDYFKIRNNIMGKYNSMDLNEKTDVANVAFELCNKFFNKLGFRIKMERI